MADRLQIRRDTAANWTSANPILAQGEWGYELDQNKLKIGDGVLDWVNLPYFAGGGGGYVLKEIFTYSGSSTFTLSETPSDIIAVDLGGHVLDGVSGLAWTLIGDEVTIIYDLNAGDSIQIIYAVGSVGGSAVTTAQSTSISQSVVNAQKDQEGGIAANDTSILSLDTVDDLSTQNRLNRTRAYVNGDGQGGSTFTYFPSGSGLVADGGVVYNALDGGFWKRDFDGGLDAVRAGLIGDGVSSNNVRLSELNSLPYEIVFSNGIFLVDSDITINFPVKVNPTAKIKVLGDSRITFNGSFTAGDYEIFDFSEANYYNPNIDNTGNVEFGRGVIDYVKVSWFGAKNNTESARAIQRAIWSIIQGEVVLDNASYLISETILLRNSITISGKGYRTATQLVATEQFNDPLNGFTVKVDGLPAFICGHAQPSGVGELEYQIWLGDWRKVNHVCFQNFQILGLNNTGVGFMGSFYESSFTGVYVYGFDIGYWMHTSNTRIIGSGQIAMNNIGLKLGGGGGYISPGTMIQNDVHIDIGWPYEVTSGEFGSIDLKIDEPYIEGHNGGIKFLVREGVTNLTVVAAHMYGNVCSAWSVHPSSQVYQIGLTTMVGLVDILPQSVISSKTISIPDFGIKKGIPIQYVPDGDLSNDFTGSLWTLENSTVLKTMYRNQDGVQSMSFDNKLVLHVSSTNEINSVTSGYIDHLGMIDFEYGTNLNRDVKLTIIDSLDSVIYDSGWQRGCYTERTMNNNSRKICGYVAESGTGPWRAKVEGRNLTGSSKGYQIRKLCIYKAFGLENYTSTSGGGSYNLLSPEESYNGFSVFEFSGPANGAVINGGIVPSDVMDGQLKLMGWIGLSDSNNRTSVKSRLSDSVTLYNEYHRRFLLYEDFEWFEQHHELRQAGRVVNHTANPFKGAGLAWVPFYPETSSGVILDSIPSEGWWRTGQKVYFTTPAASGHIGAVCVSSGTPGTWKNFGSIEA